MTHRDAPAFARFVLVGLVNTAVTGGLLVALSRVMSLSAAYTIVFALGLCFSTVATGRFVFRTEVRLGPALRFVGWYLAVYGLGLVVIHVAQQDLHVSRLAGAAIVILVTVPLNFLGGRLAFRRSAPTWRPTPS